MEPKPLSFAIFGTRKPMVVSWRAGRPGEALRQLRQALSDGELSREAAAVAASWVGRLEFLEQRTAAAWN